MKRISPLVLLLLSIFNNASFCQENSFKGPIIYLEAAGAGYNTYNLNLKHLIVTKSRWHVNARVAYGYLKKSGDINQNIIAGLNLYYGNRKSHPEIGLYLTYSNRNYGRNTYSEDHILILQISESNERIVLQS